MSQAALVLVRPLERDGEVASDRRWGPHGRARAPPDVRPLRGRLARERPAARARRPHDLEPRRRMVANGIRTYASARERTAEVVLRPAFIGRSVDRTWPAI